MKREFIAGFAAAAAEIVRTHGENQIAADVIATNGLMLKDFEGAGLDDYDMSIIRQLFREEHVLKEPAS